jgi:hypothetical protein
MSAVPTNIPDCLRTEVCPNCAYALKGSPHVGDCPECGRPFNQSEIILYGSARGVHQNPGNVKISRLIWLLIYSYFIFVPQSPVLMRQLTSNPALLGTFIKWAAGLAVFLWVSNRMVLAFRRHKMDHPGLTQIRLSEAGCVQYDSVTGPSLISELSQAHGWSFPILGIMGLYAICEFGWLRFPLFWIISPFLLLAAFNRWFRCRRFRQELRQLRDGAIADRNIVLHSTVPWNQILNFSIRPVREPIRRLRIASLTGGKSEEFPIDAEIRCSREQAQHLVKWLNDHVHRSPGRRLETPIAGR